MDAKLDADAGVRPPDSTPAPGRFPTLMRGSAKDDEDGPNGEGVSGMVAAVLCGDASGVTTGLPCCIAGLGMPLEVDDCDVGEHAEIECGIVGWCADDAKNASASAASASAAANKLATGPPFGVCTNF